MTVGKVVQCCFLMWQVVVNLNGGSVIWDNSLRLYYILWDNTKSISLPGAVICHEMKLSQSFQKTSTLLDHLKGSQKLNLDHGISLLHFCDKSWTSLYHVPWSIPFWIWRCSSHKVSWLWCLEPIFTAASTRSLAHSTYCCQRVVKLAS